MDQEFDFGKGEEAADKGMSDATRAGRVHAWQVDAGRWFMSLPVGAVINADDLTKAVGLPDEGPNRNNVIGAFFNGLARGGFIRWTGHTVKSERVDRHTGMNREWVKEK